MYCPLLLLKEPPFPFVHRNHRADISQRASSSRSAPNNSILLWFTKRNAFIVDGKRRIDCVIIGFTQGDRWVPPGTPSHITGKGRATIMWPLPFQRGMLMLQPGKKEDFSTQKYFCIEYVRKYSIYSTHKGWILFTINDNKRKNLVLLNTYICKQGGQGCMQSSCQILRHRPHGLQNWVSTWKVLDSPRRPSSGYVSIKEGRVT